MNKAYYYRVMSKELEQRLLSEYSWLIDYVIGHEDTKGNKDLDFQSGSNPKIPKTKDKIIYDPAKSWLSIYKGTGRIITIKKAGVPYRLVQNGTRNDKNGKEIKKYKKEYLPELLMGKEEGKKKLTSIIEDWDNEESKGRYYIDYSEEKEDKKEGFYQTLVSRRYSLNYKIGDDLLIFDKEFKIGYISEEIKDNEFMRPIKSWVYAMKDKIAKDFKEHDYDICKAIDKEKGPEEFEKISTECDFVGLNNKGDIVLLELKRHGDGNKIYLSPLQVGTYYKLLSQYIEKEGLPVLQDVIFEMVKQKQRLGIINKDYKLPSKLSGNIKLAVVVGGEAGKQAKEQYKIVRQIIEKNIKDHIVDNEIMYYTCDENDGTLKKEIIKD